jgi:hypothetical protein
MNACRNIHETRRVGLYVKGVSHGFVNEGEKKCRNFVNSVLSVGQSVSFYSPISKSKLKTFEHMNAKASLKCTSGDVLWFFYVIPVKYICYCIAKHDVNGLQ